MFAHGLAHGLAVPAFRGGACLHPLQGWHDGGRPPRSGHLPLPGRMKPITPGRRQLDDACSSLPVQLRASRHEFAVALRRRGFLGRGFLGLGLLGLGLVAAGCGRGRRTGDVGATPLDVVGARHGRLVDVYSIRSTTHGEGSELYAKDVLVGYELPEHCEYRGVDPETLNARVLVRLPASDAGFGDVLGKLEQGAVTVDLRDRGGLRAPVPRDAATELVFDHELPVDLAFFAELDSAGRVRGAKNVTAVRVVQRMPGAADEAVPVRFAVRGNRLLVDPVLAESEAEAWKLPANGLGLPESSPGDGANLEVRLSTGQPDSLPGLRGIGLQLAGADIVLPLRSGNSTDRGGYMAGGFSTGRLAPRLLGALTMYLEQVVDVDTGTQEVTLFKNGIVHDIDDGDVIRLFIDNGSVPVLVTDIIADPLDDRGLPAVSHVRALVTRTAGLRENDPRRLPNYPSDPRSPQGEQWLVANAPRAVLMAEFAAERRAGGRTYGDDPRYFVQWSPAPLAGVAVSEPCDDVSPFAGAVVRFSQPVDPATVRAADTLFFATRDVMDPAALLSFVQRQNIDPQVFDVQKFRTPHLVAATALPVDGSNTTFRLQAPYGFYLDAAMRRADEGQSFANKTFKYQLHVVSGTNGIADTSGNQLELGWLTPRQHVAVPFALDMRRDGSGRPLFADNYVASVTRRFQSRDEDEQPSYYLADEVQAPNATPNPYAFPLDDLLGAVIYLPEGRLEGRPTSRVRAVADDLNQLPPPPQTSPLRWCPVAVGGEPQVATSTAAVRFGVPIQNPTNPFGCRMQTLWREIDLGVSRVDPFDFNLDVEAMYWGVHSTTTVVFDRFPRTSLYLGHGEHRPEPCVGVNSALPSLAPSGLLLPFADNYVHNLDRTGAKEMAPPPQPAFVDQAWTIDPTRLVFEPNRVNRYAPMPAFESPAFVWRDETMMAQGGNSHTGGDVFNSAIPILPYIVSPSLQGQGRYVTLQNNQFAFNLGYWSNAENFQLDLSRRNVRDTLTGGSVGSIALPLLADVQVHPAFDAADHAVPPVGANGWQIALTVQTSALPAFRAFSSGGLVNGVPMVVDPTRPEWDRAVGGINPVTGQRTPASDNSLYWSMFDFAKTRSVATFGFVELLDPHRMPATVVDPRLGPYFGRSFPANNRIAYSAQFEPPLDRQAPGTRIDLEFRGAGVVDPQPWRSLERRLGYVAPDAKNFPLDPLKAADAHIRKNDDRPVGAVARDWWTYPYNKNLTDYTRDPAQLSDPAFVARFAGPNDTFTPDDVRYVNWRFILHNSTGATPRAPRIDTFMLSYRFESR
ncbi:MAG: hypothetical protein R3F56_22650 [Planctomycetota bacterium]